MGPGREIGGHALFLCYILIAKLAAQWHSMLVYCLFPLLLLFAFLPLPISIYSGAVSVFTVHCSLFTWSIPQIHAGAVIGSRHGLARFGYSTMYHTIQCS